MEKKIVVVGEMDNSDGTFESLNRVYDKRRICPTIPTCGGGNIQPKVVRMMKMKVAGGIKTNPSEGFIRGPLKLGG